MRLPSGKAVAAFDRPDPAIRFYLLSGVDGSASRLLAQRLLKGLGAEKVPTSGAQLKNDPRWLAEEAASISMFGGSRLLWIEPAGDDSLAAVEALLDLPAVESPTVAIAGLLKKTNALLKLADSHPAAVHVQSEPLGLPQQAAAIVELGTAEGLRVPLELAKRIAVEANGDLILARLELQKFALYLDAAPDQPKPLNEEVVEALGIDQAEADWNRPGDLALAGDLPGLAAELALLDSSAIDAIPVVRALQKRLLLLAPLRGRMDGGQRLDAVLGSVWGRDKQPVTRILPRWTAPRLIEAFGRVQQLERELLMQPVPPSAALGETLLAIARAAARR